MNRHATRLGGVLILSVALTMGAALTFPEERQRGMAPARLVTRSHHLPHCPQPTCSGSWRSVHASADAAPFPAAAEKIDRLRCRHCG